MEDCAVTSIPVDRFRSGVDHFDTWIKYFEDAIDVTHPTADAATKEQLCIKWFPLKLDDKGRLTHEGITGANWAEIKRNFREASKDPEEEYNWHARRVTITWDGVESFQDLETRIKRSVDLYNTTDKVQECFFRFRLALPPNYRYAIDMGCKKENRTIAEARSIAERVRLAYAERNEEGAVGGEPAGATAASPQPKAVPFAGAAMSDDVLSSLETAMRGLSMRVENAETRQDEDRRRNRSPIGDEENNQREYHSGRRSDGRYDGWDRYDHQDDYDRQHDYDRRDDYDRHVDDEGRSRRDRDWYPQGERSYNPSRYDSPDRWHGDHREQDRYDRERDYDRQHNSSPPGFRRHSFRSDNRGRRYDDDGNHYPSRHRDRSYRDREYEY